MIAQLRYATSNVTGRHRGFPVFQSMCMCERIVCLPVCGAPGECYYNTLICYEDYFSSSSVISSAFSALCVYSKFGHHPHPQATFVRNFVSFSASIAELAHGEKSHTQSITHSLTQLIWCPGNRSLCFGIDNTEQFCPPDRQDCCYYCTVHIKWFIDTYPITLLWTDRLKMLTGNTDDFILVRNEQCTHAALQTAT